MTVTLTLSSERLSSMTNGFATNYIWLVVQFQTAEKLRLSRFVSFRLVSFACLTSHDEKRGERVSCVSISFTDKLANFCQLREREREAKTQSAV